MAKKDFSNINKSGVYNNSVEGTIAAATAEPLIDTAATKKSVGRPKRQEAIAKHINIGFTQDQYDYLKNISGFYGKSITDYLTGVIAADKEKHAKTLEQLAELKKAQAQK